MRISDRRLGEVLVRTDHVRQLRSVNPVAHAVVEELAREHGPFDQEVRETAWLFLDELGVNEPGAPRLSMRTVLTIMADAEREQPDQPELELRRLASHDPLLGISVDALTGYSTQEGRRRSPDERGAVASVLLALLRMFRAQEQAEELGRSLEGRGGS